MILNYKYKLIFFIFINEVIILITIKNSCNCKIYSSNLANKIYKYFNFVLFDIKFLGYILLKNYQL